MLVRKAFAVSSTDNRASRRHVDNALTEWAPLASMNAAADPSRAIGVGHHESIMNESVYLPFTERHLGGHSHIP